MRRIIQLLLLTIATTTFAQEFHVPYRKGILWGFANKEGKIVVEPKYDSVAAKMENFRWQVYKDGKTGIINTEGIERLAVEYDSIFRNPVHSRYNEFEVFKNGLQGYTDINGKFLLPVAYKSIAKVNDDSMNELELKFFVKGPSDKHFSLITEQQAELLGGVESFKNIYNGRFIIVKGKKAGIYNTITKTWEVQPLYQAIKRFDYQDFYEPKPEFRNIKYYGINGTKIDLFTKSYQLVPTKLTKLSEFFTKLENTGGDYASEGSPVSASSRKLTTVTGENYSDNKKFKTTDFYRTHIKLSVIKIDDKYQIRTNSPAFKVDNRQLFDEVQLLKSPWNDEYDPNVALVKNKNKWMLFDIAQNQSFSDVVFDTFEFHKKYDDFLILTNNGKVGLFKLRESMDTETAAVIKPIYDSFETFDYLRSIDENYDRFILYYFKKDGQLYPVGVNGIKYFQE